MILLYHYNPFKFYLKFSVRFSSTLTGATLDPDAVNSFIDDVLASSDNKKTNITAVKGISEAIHYGYVVSTSDRDLVLRDLSTSFFHAIFNDLKKFGANDKVSVSVLVILNLKSYRRLDSSKKAFLQKFIDDINSLNSSTDTLDGFFAQSKIRSLISLIQSRCTEMLSRYDFSDKPLISPSDIHSVLSSTINSFKVRYDIKFSLKFNILVKHINQINLKEKDNIVFLNKDITRQSFLLLQKTLKTAEDMKNSKATGDMKATEDKKTSIVAEDKKTTPDTKPTPTGVANN